MSHWLERYYPYVPIWAQNLGISLYGLTYCRERLGGDFEQHVAGFRERDRWSPAEMNAYVEERLRQTLLQAYDNVPYYRRKWSEAGIGRSELAQLSLSELPRIPITPKSDLRSAPGEFVDQKVAKAEKLHRYHSSGSTGTPITAICTAEAHRKFIAAREVRSFGWAGASVHMPRSTLGGRMIVPRGDAPPPFYRYNWAEKQVYLSAYHISPQTIRNYVEGLERYRPALLTGYAHAHFLLARMMCEARLSLNYEPKAIVLSSEALTDEMRPVISLALRARAYTEYSAVENCLLATECSHGRLHVNPDFGVIEIVDKNGDPVGPGGEGRVLCTGLLNEAQPLIRYEIGDVAAWSNEICPCGRSHLPVLDQLVGRLEDVVIGLDGREINRFHGIFIDLDHVIEGQIVQEKRDLISVNVVAAAGFNERDEEVIRRRISGERLPGMRVEIRKVDQIERSASGKFRAVISRVRSQPKPAAPVENSRR